MNVIKESEISKLGFWRKKTDSAQKSNTFAHKYQNRVMIFILSFQCENLE